MDEAIVKTVEWLKKRQMRGWPAENTAEAREIILGIVAADAVVGIGDSSSVRQVGVIDALRARGTVVINPFDPTNDVKDVQTNFDNMFWPSMQAAMCDVYMTGSNAITGDGRILNIDGAGNRVAGMFFGHPVSIIVVGKNKIVANLEEAMSRVKNVVAPEHLKRKGSAAPCAKTGRCHDCSGPDRVCAVTTIIERNPVLTQINVVIVNEDLGLSWDRSWPEERIAAIRARHEQHMVLCPIPRTLIDATDIEQLWKMALARKKGRPGDRRA